jgi:hypothetical protein
MQPAAQLNRGSLTSQPTTLTIQQIPRKHSRNPQRGSRRTRRKIDSRPSRRQPRMDLRYPRTFMATYCEAKFNAKMGNNGGRDADSAPVADQTQDGGEVTEGTPMNSKQRKKVAWEARQAAAREVHEAAENQKGGPHATVTSSQGEKTGTQNTNVTSKETASGAEQQKIPDDKHATAQVKDVTGGLKQPGAPLPDGKGKSQTNPGLDKHVANDKINTPLAVPPKD